MSGGKGVRRGEAGWRQMVSGQVSSGLTVSKYCAREGICAASFYRWQRLLCGASAPQSDLSSAAAEQTFVDLGTLMRPGASVQVRLELGGGVVLQLSRG